MSYLAFKYKLKPTKEKKNSETDKLKRTLGITVGSFSSLFPKSVQQKPKTFGVKFPKIVSQKPQKSVIDFTRHESDEDIQEEKLKTLKSISSKLDLLKGSGKTSQKKPEEKKTNILDIIKNSLLGAGAGALLMKGKGLVGKVGGLGNVLKGAVSVIDLVDIISRIKSGFGDYSLAKSSGDGVKADGIIFKTVIGSFGDLFEGIGSWLPAPLNLIFGGFGTFMKSTANDYDSIVADKSNTGIQAKQKAAYAMDRLDQGKKYGIVQLKPTTDNWLYKNYDTDDWEPLLSSDGKPLSVSQGVNRIQEAGSDDKGVSKYKIQTQNGLADLILENGKPKMKLGDTISDISPRKSGGFVKKGSAYIVGEVGPEAYQTNEVKSRNESELFMNTFSEINSNFKKIVSKINFEKFLQVFTPETVTYKLVDVAKSVESGVGKLSKTGFQKLIDFSNVSKNPDERFDTFIKQIYVFEGGYVDSASDLGGKTKFGITHKTYDAYRKKHHLPIQDVSNLTREEADQIYKENFWKGSGADQIQDPKLAFAFFDAYIAGPQRAKALLKQSGGDVNKFLDLRNSTWTEQAHKINPKTGASQMANLSGWLNRDETQREMFAESSSQKAVEISSSNNIKSIEPPLSKRQADANFLINKVVPAMAEHVINNYGTE